LPDVVLNLTNGLKKISNFYYDILIIDNGSKDNTVEVISSLEKQYACVSHIKLPENKGYGFGIRKGLEVLNGDIVGYMWGDNQFDAGVVAEMVKEFIKNEQIMIVKTYRTKRHDGRYRLLISSIYQILFKMLYGGYVKDINSGPKLFKEDLFRRIIPLNSNDWFIDAEIMIKVTKLLKKEEIVQLPIEFFPRKYGKSNVKFNACLEFVHNLVKYKFSKS